MRALQFKRSLPRYGAARVAGGLAPGSGARVGPLRLAEIDEPALPAPGWQRIRPRLSGICGSDLSTIDGKSSRYFEPIVSFPFVPGHEIVADSDTGRVVVEPVLNCIPRGIDPPCSFCASGQIGSCQNLTLGDLHPGLQTGSCADTGGGWSTAMVAHQSQLHPVPGDLTDEAAVMVEPAASAIHAALRPGVEEPATVVVLGAGTIGLCTIAAVRRHLRPGTLIASAKHPEQRKLAVELGADAVVEPGELRRAVRRITRSPMVGDAVGEGAEVVYDCVGSADSLEDALAVVRPRARVVLVGMPGRVSIDLAALWHKETSLLGAYTYGREATGERTFDLAFDLVREADLGRLVSATYPLDRYRDAIDHAANAGSRGAVKVVFDLRGERNR
ncbi:MAG TPA: zinc-binding dehydrogenase [Acidimicrobiales bacterium]|nr:zinc-binding dehydrogenase [Acidimicrobiales bacterium]